MPNKKTPELMKACVVGGDGKSTTAKLVVFGKDLEICFDGKRHGERALVWAQKWNDHCIKCNETLLDVASKVLDEFAEALVFQGVDYAVIETALDDCKIGKDDE